MKAWRIYGVGDFRLDELPSQPVGEGCVKLKISSSALSITDRMMFEGKLAIETLPLILGRQGVGMVTEVGEGVTTFARGDRVAIEPSSPCGVCFSCKSGKVSECEKLLTFGVNEDGFIRDFAVVPQTDIFKLPERVKNTEAVFLEHIALSLNTLSKLEIEKGEHIVIVGCDVVGIILAQLALYYQAVPIIVDNRQDRLSIAESLGVYYTINSVETDVKKKIFSLTGGRMAETVVHIAFSNMPLSRSLEYAARGGRISITGWNGIKDELTLSLTPLLDRQLHIFGVNNGTKQISSAINMLANKTVSVQPLISCEVPFESVGDTIKDMKESPEKYIKALVKI